MIHVYIPMRRGQQVRLKEPKTSELNFLKNLLDQCNSILCNHSNILGQAKTLALADTHIQFCSAP